jgi:hypothetical protein
MLHGNHHRAEFEQIVRRSGKFVVSAKSITVRSLIDGVVSAIAGFDNNQFLLRQLVR